MEHTRNRRRRSALRIAVAAAALACGALHAEEGPEPTEPSDPDAYGSRAADPDALRTTPVDPDEIRAAPVDPGERSATPSDPEEHEGRSVGLDEVPTGPPDPDTGPLELPGQDEWEPADDPEVAAARQALRAAQARAREAIGSYRRMIRRNYPRGEARAAIVRERNESLAALERAEDRLRRVDPTVPAAPR